MFDFCFWYMLLSLCWWIPVLHRSLFVCMFVFCWCKPIFLYLLSYLMVFCHLLMSVHDLFSLGFFQKYNLVPKVCHPILIDSSTVQNRIHSLACWSCCTFATCIFDIQLNISWLYIECLLLSSVFCCIVLQSYIYINAIVF